MTIENQVCNLELAKRLKELGVKQESYFEWNEYNDMGNKSIHINPVKDRGFHTTVVASAFTVAELGELLPEGNFSIKKIGIKEWECGNNITSYLGKIQGLPPCDLHFEEADNEVDARAKMLIYLLENKLTTL